MSVKLYDAWRMPTMPMSKFQKWLDELRSTYQPIADKKILIEIAHRAIRKYDISCVFPNSIENNKPGNGYLTNSWSKVMTDYKKVKTTGSRDPAVDVECEIIFHFRGRYIYMVMFTEIREFKDHLESLPGIKEYGYWDNTDKPGYITQREWRRREKLWDNIFGRKQYMKGGVMWMLVGDYDIALPRKGVIEQHFTPFNKRLSFMLTDAVFKQYPGEITSATLMKAHKWLRSSPEALQIKEELKPKIIAMMKKELTFEDLNT